jgi:hypothetical protein
MSDGRYFVKVVGWLIELVVVIDNFGNAINMDVFRSFRFEVTAGRYHCGEKEPSKGMLF